MIKLKKLMALGVSSLTAMCLVSAVNANDSYACSINNGGVIIKNGDVNGDGVTNVADAVNIRQYLIGYYNLAEPDVADYNNDGFVSETDATIIQYLGIGVNKPINANYTPSQKTQLNNCNMTYKKYNANGIFQGSYTIEAAPVVNGTSTQAIIGSNDAFEDNTHSAICTIKVGDNLYNGFVASDNSILTAASAINQKKISKIYFYDNNGEINHVMNTNAVTSYSIPANYVANTDTDYALIKVSSDLSYYNVFDFGYALQHSIDAQANVSVTAYQLKDEKQPDGIKEIRTGNGRIFTSSDEGMLDYDCDVASNPDATVYGTGAPIYADLIFEGQHYYTVVGIHLSEGPNRYYNYGVRMCPNITNLIRTNLN